MPTPLSQQHRPPAPKQNQNSWQQNKLAQVVFAKWRLGQMLCQRKSLKIFLALYKPQSFDLWSCWSSILLTMTSRTCQVAAMLIASPRPEMLRTHTWGLNTLRVWCAAKQFPGWWLIFHNFPSFSVVGRCVWLKETHTTGSDVSVYLGQDWLACLAFLVHHSCEESLRRVHVEVDALLGSHLVCMKALRTPCACVFLWKMREPHKHVFGSVRFMSTLGD